MSKPLKFRTIEIDGKAFDVPKDMPLPRIGERVSVCFGKFGTVIDVVYQFQDTRDYMITIKTICE